MKTSQEHGCRIIRYAIPLFLSLLLSVTIFATTYPVPLQDRIEQSKKIVLGQLIEKIPYWDQDHKMIYTLNLIEVDAWIKGAPLDHKVIGIITLGGVLENEAYLVSPSPNLEGFNEYLLFLEGDNFEMDHKGYRDKHPEVIQSLLFADVQGKLTKQLGFYHDLHYPTPQTEAEVFQFIENHTQERFKTLTGAIFLPRRGDTKPLFTSSVNKTFPITSFAPSPTNAGTIESADFITIQGSGFTGTPGTVFYSNAEDGGATFTASGVATDVVSWSDTEIEHKVAGDAGTGPININGVQTSSSDLVINYAHEEINSTFAGFGITTRQRFHLIDNNGLGGYTLIYNTSFAANTDATDAFERALNSWKAATQVNFIISESTSASSTIGDDGENLVFFIGALPLGVLSRANLFFQASATGACNQENTVWWVEDIDIEFKSDPPAGCCSWNFTSASTASNQFDFESAALRELGRGFGLGYVIANGEVMHYELLNGVDVRSLSTNDITGLNAKLAYSTAPFCFNPAGVNGSHQLSSVVPVSWLEFYGENKGTKNHLIWKVAQELNNKGFEIQRKGQSGWHPIGFVPGNGTIFEERRYSFIDSNPLPGENYYRLKQLDLDGAFSYSTIIRLVSTHDGFKVRVFPNPITRQTIHFEVLSSQDTPILVDLYNSKGQLIGKKILEENLDENRTVGKMRIPNNTSGILWLRIIMGNEIRVVKVLNESQAKIILNQITQSSETHPLRLWANAGPKPGD